PDKTAVKALFFSLGRSTPWRHKSEAPVPSGRRPPRAGDLVREVYGRVCERLAAGLYYRG
ncbi:jg27471, partial [Pararge aegeria aegeria]